MSIDLSLDSASLPYVVAGALAGLLAGILFRFVSPEFRSGARGPVPIGGLVGLGAFCGVWVSWVRLLTSALASDDPLGGMVRVPWPLLFLLPGVAVGTLVAWRLAASRSRADESHEPSASLRRRWGAMGAFVGSVLAVLVGGVVWFVLNMAVVWDIDRLPQRVDARLAEKRVSAGRERAQPSAPERGMPGGSRERTRNPLSPLHQAAMRDDVDEARRLLDQGADTNATDPHGWTPLHSAAASRATGVAKLLLEHGANVNARNAVDYTPLHLAAWQDDRIAVAELLLAHGADVNARSDLGWTPLHNAADKGCIKTARLLLAHGAAINAQDTMGRTPGALAIERGHPEFAGFLRAQGG
jgi:hypothetical protein